MEQLYTDKEVLQDALTAEKTATNNYNTYANECVHDTVREAILNCLSEEHNHAGLIELADTLVNGGSRNTAFARDLQKGHSRILDQILEDFPIDRVQYCFCHIASVLFT